MPIKVMVIFLLCAIVFLALSTPVQAYAAKKKKPAKKHTTTQKKKKRLEAPAYKNIGEPKYGVASYYSKNLHGTKTSTGERYSNQKLTCASNNFKLNSWVKVTNLRNKKTVVVRVNDRMHPRMAKKGRVVDLSYAAAKEISMLKAGLVKVKVQQVKRS